MKPPEFYAGKEQTYLKHFFLERYLQRVAFHIGYNFPQFVYVDGFSGPWRAQGEDLADTSFRIALDQLNYVRRGLAEPPHLKSPSIGAVFVERNAAPFISLQQAIESAKGAVKANALRGTFEKNIPAILDLVGRAFGFFFIDPKGWTGFAMETIKPILLHRPGEVIINFMYDYINRFLNYTDPRNEASLDRLFGTPGWRSLRDAEDREHAIVDYYREQIRKVGNFEFVTSTRILKPTHDRAYFHLIYATRNSKGVAEFRAVEKKAVAEQEQVRWTAKRQAREARSGQSEFDLEFVPSLASEFDQEKSRQLRRAEERMLRLLQKDSCAYEVIHPRVLELSLVWDSDFKSIVETLRDSGRIRIEGLGPRDRVAKPGCRFHLV